MTAATFFLWAATGAQANWWTAYGDPQLAALVERAVAQNPDLKLAAGRIAEARAVAGETRSALLPAINTTSGTQRLRGGFQQGVIRIPRQEGAPQGGSFVAPFDTPVYQGGFDMRWELDFFGANRARLTASRADLAAEEEQRRDTALSVAAEMARAYMDWRGVEERRAIVERARDAQRELLALTRTRAEAGLESSLDVERQAALLANTEASLEPLEAERAVALHRMATLVGDRQFRPPAPAVPLRAPALEQPIDAELLARRPDVRAAMARIAAAEARTKAARSDLYPKLTLSGLMGRQAVSPGGLTLGGGNFFSFGPQLQLPIFSGGRIRANIAAHEARTAQARTQVDQELLLAFEEAGNALARYQAERRRLERLEEGVGAARRSLELARDLQQAGLADFLAVLDAERELLAMEEQRSRAATEVLTQSVAAYKAVGGGWRP